MENEENWISANFNYIVAFMIGAVIIIAIIMSTRSTTDKGKDAGKADDSTLNRIYEFITSTMFVKILLGLLVIIGLAYGGYKLYQRYNPQQP